jgi:hypothetical protein
MSKIIRTTYKCDYCNVEKDSYQEMYASDNSGLNNKNYDMCNEECYHKHYSMLQEYYKDYDDRMAEIVNHEFLFVTIHRRWCQMCYERSAIQGEGLCRQCKEINESDKSMY